MPLPSLYFNIISITWNYADVVYNEFAALLVHVAQTEGDTGYDYNDAYEDEFYDESGAPVYVITCEILIFYIISADVTSVITNRCRVTCLLVATHLYLTYILRAIFRAAAT